MDSEDEASDNGDAEEEEKPRQRQSPKADERLEPPHERMQCECAV